MKKFEEKSQEFAGINDDKYGNIALCYDKFDIADAFEKGAEFMLKHLKGRAETPEVIQELFNQLSDMGVSALQDEMVQIRNILFKVE